MKLKIILGLFLFVAMSDCLHAQQNPIRFSVTVDSVACKYVLVVDSTGNLGEKRIEMGDGSFRDNNYNLHENHPNDHYINGKFMYRYIKNGSFVVTYTLKHFDSSVMAYRTDTLRKTVNIQCDSCSLIANFQFKFTTVDPSKAFLNSEHKGFSYNNQWTLGDGDSSNLDSFVHKYASAGYHRIKLVTSIYDSSLQRYCTDSVSLKIYINSSGLNELNSLSQIKIYPNPFQSQFQIENKSERKEIIAVYNMNGKKLDSFEVEPDSIFYIDCMSWSRGLYTLVLSDGSIMKLLKE